MKPPRGISEAKEKIRAILEKRVNFSLKKKIIHINL